MSQPSLEFLTSPRGRRSSATRSSSSIVFMGLQIMAAVMVYAERKVAAFMQQRYGPYLRRTARACSSRSPTSSSCSSRKSCGRRRRTRSCSRCAPIISVTAAYLAFAPVPFGAPTTFFGLLDEPLRAAGRRRQRRGAGDLRRRVDGRLRHRARRAGLEQLKYSLLGGLRSSAQMISYELAYGMALATVVMMANSMSLREIVDTQSGYWFGLHPAVVHLPAADRLLRVRVRRRRRDQPRAVRLPGSRAGAGRRLSHRIQLDALRDVLHGGVHQHGDGLGGRDEPVPRRLARAVPPGRLRLDLVRDQARRSCCSSICGCAGRCRDSATTS